MMSKNISKFHTDENLTRLIALQVIIILLVVLLTPHNYLMVVLVVDFALRAFTYLPAPTAFIARIVVKLFNIERKPIIVSPKKFAAAIGFVFSLGISVLLWLNLQEAALAVIAVLVFFAFLEAAFKLCVGCYVYNWLVAPIVNKRNNKFSNKKY